MKIVLTGGGSGGHVFPNFALLPILKKHAEIFYIGERGKLEERLSKENGIPFFAIDAPKFIRSFCVKNLSVPTKLLKSTKEARQILLQISPDVVFSKGGYVALPVAFAAKRSGVPLVIHESDSTFGLANKLSAPFADKILTSFEIKRGGKYITTFAPIRDEILRAKKRKLFPMSKKPVLLVLGGSLGARELNDYCLSNKEKLTGFFDVVLITGENKGETSVEKGFLKLPFAENIGEYLASADIALSRGGSGALFEFALKKLPALIVPLKSSSRGEQKANAEYFAKKGLIRHHDLRSDIFDELVLMYNDRGLFMQAFEKCDISDGKEKIAAEILNVAAKRKAQEERKL